MGPRFKYILWIPAIIISLSSSAQERATISGIVLDGATQKPIPFVNVYFDNTTIGSTTDESGRYVINNIPADLSELTFSSVGYSTIKVPDLKLPPGTKISVDVKMAPSTTTLAAITIKSDRRNDWSSKFKQFKRIFLGTTANAAKTEILNPEVLSFEEITGDSIDAKGFVARASAPLEIENRALGYHITVFMEDFQSIGSSYSIVITTRFDTLTTSSRLQEQRWKKNRLDAYKGSQLQLFRSIADGTYEQEGFRIFSVSAKEGTSRIPAPLSDLVLDSTRSDLKILRMGVYQIHYYHKVVPFSLRTTPADIYPTSTISVIDDHLRLYPNGHVKQPSNYWRSGYLYNFRIADLLPSDYDAVVEEGKLTLSAQREFATLKGTVVDKEGGPLSGVQVFINNGLHQTTTNAWGKFEITNLYPGKYPIAFAYGGKQELIQMVDLTQQSEYVIVVELKEKPVSPLPGGQLIDAKLHDTYVRLFWNTMFTGMGKWSFAIANPQALQFVKQKKTIKAWSTSPLIIENLRLGYTWTYFISDATIRRKKLSISGLIKMDTIEANSQAERRRWENNRMSEYRGSWSHLINSLIQGRSEAEGFQYYQLKRDLGKRKPQFETLSVDDVRPIEPDSILVAKRGVLSLNVLPGLEIHNNNLVSPHNFYKRHSKQVLRLTSDSSHVAISRTGSVDTADLKITGRTAMPISTVPIDYEFVKDQVTNPNVLLYVKEQNLKALKNLLEKAYVHTDRPYYYPGDTIWFKAYLRYANLNYSDSLGNVLYTELLNPEGTVVGSSVLKITHGVSWGDIVIASNLEPADYYLRVYTNWMRNFDEFMIRPVPIISRKSFIQPGPADTTSTSGDLQISLTTDKATYGTRDKIELGVTISKEDLPIVTNFSVSVTDQSAVSDIEGVPNILSLNQPFKADGAELIRLSHPMEHDIVLGGRISGASASSENIVTTVFLNGAGKVITPTIGPNFNVVIDFVDTTTAIIQCVSTHGVPARVELMERQPVESYHLPHPLSYKLVTDGSYIRIQGKPDEPVTILQEVAVGATPIPNPQPLVPTPTQRRFGMAYQIFQGKDLSNVRLTGNLLDYLALHLPDFHDTRCWTETGKICYTPANAPKTGIPLDVPVSVYSFFLNGHPLSASDFDLIPVNNVSRIEVYWMPGKKGNKVAIYTEQSFPHDVRNFALYKVKGYDRPNVFRIPSKERVEPDYRPTIYWNPSIDTDTDGKAVLSFNSSDVDGTYKVTVEGVTSEGEYFRSTKYLNIAK